MKLDKVWMPKEIHQKETILFYIPIISKAVTSREFFYFILGIIIDIPLLFIFNLFSSENLILEDKIVRIIIIFFILLAIPIFFSVVSLSKTNGEYLEDRILKRIYYKKNSELLLNEKTIKSMKESNYSNYGGKNV